MVLGVEYSKISPQSPKTKFGIQNQYGRDILIVREFYMEQKKLAFGSQKGANKPSEPKNGIWTPKSIYDIHRTENLNS
jgi:hypothetical protein